MTLAHFKMLIHRFLNKDPDVVLEESPLIRLGGELIKPEIKKAILIFFLLESFDVVYA